MSCQSACVYFSATYRQDAATKRQPVSSSSQLQRFQSSKIPWWSDVVAVTPRFLASNYTIISGGLSDIRSNASGENSTRSRATRSDFPSPATKNVLDSAMKLK